MNYLSDLSDTQLFTIEIEVASKVSFWDGADDAMYKVWKTLLELVWMEKKRRSL